MPRRLSFVIPFMNEAETLGPLWKGIAASVRACQKEGDSFEVLLVDDGSTDDSVRVAESLIATNPEIRLIELRGNFGKSAALAAGFEAAEGDLVFTMDADLQDDPAEIPRFIEKLEEGYDLVSGYKRARHDPLTKVIPSRVFNWMVRTLTGTRLHDINCGFKVYRRVVIDNLQLYGELHRFVPALAHARRFKIAEIAVTHHPRRFGRSKFGAGRFFRGLADLLTVYFLMKYERRPAHFFGMFGAVCMGIGFILCAYLSLLWLTGEAIGQRPLLILGVLLMVVGAQFLATGLIAELLVHGRSSGPPYLVRRVVGRRAEDASADHAPR